VFSSSTNFEVVLLLAISQKKNEEHSYLNFLIRVGFLLIDQDMMEGKRNE